MMDDGTMMKDVMIDSLSFSESLILSLSKQSLPFKEYLLKGVGKYSFPKNKIQIKEKTKFVINKKIGDRRYTGQILDLPIPIKRKQESIQNEETVLYGHGYYEGYEGYFNKVKLLDFANLED